MNILQKPCLILTILGAINWGLVGLFDFDLVKFITMNQVNIWTRIIYCIIAIAGIINIILLFINLSESMETKIEKVK
ncbi:hypothetical conserved protein [Firmicutes bacterium CAG:449]|nr:hypothetical conserved protein [Firmicutes bacterium CAG:449]